MERIQIMLTPKEIINRILRVFVEMLIARKLLDNESLSETYEILKRTGTDDLVYKIQTQSKIKMTEDLKDVKRTSSQLYVLKIIPQELTAVSKDSGILDFLDKYDKNHKIIVVKNIGQKVSNQLLSRANTEVFSEEKMMYNVLKHDIQPEFTPLDIYLDINNDDAIKKFCEEYMVKKSQIQKMDMHDPVAEYLGLKVGQVVRILRKSESTAHTPIYKIICYSSVTKS